MRAFRLLQFFNVVLLYPRLDPEFDAVLAFDPGDVVVNFIGRQVLVMVVVSVPTAVVQHVAERITRPGSIDGGPAGYAERIR